MSGKRERETNKKKSQLCAHLNSELKRKGKRRGQLLYSALLNERRGREEEGEGGDWLNKEGSMGSCVMRVFLSHCLY